MINMTKNENLTAAPTGIFTVLPFERQTHSATSMTAQTSKIARPRMNSTKDKSFPAQGFRILNLPKK